MVKSLSTSLILRGLLAVVVGIVALAWPGVTGAIVGARKPEQVDAWIAAANVQLNAKDLKEIAAAIQQTGAGAGPVQPSSSERRPAADASHQAKA